MSRYLSALIIAGICLQAGFAQESPAADAAKNELLQVQADRFRAMTENDHDALNAILSEELTYTHTTGRTETKAEFLASLRSKNVAYNAIEPAGVQVRIRDTTAIITGVAAMKVSAGESHFSFSIRFIEVYQSVEGKWRLLAWQSTRLPDD